MRSGRAQATPERPEKTPLFWVLRTHLPKAVAWRSRHASVSATISASGKSCKQMAAEYMDYVRSWSAQARLRADLPGRKGHDLQAASAPPLPDRSAEPFASGEPSLLRFRLHATYPFQAPALIPVGIGPDPISVQYSSVSLGSQARTSHYTHGLRCVNNKRHDNTRHLVEHWSYNQHSRVTVSVCSILQTRQTQATKEQLILANITVTASCASQAPSAALAQAWFVPLLGAKQGVMPARGPR